MAAPAPTSYSLSYSFTAQQAVAPSDPPPGGALDGQFTAISVSVASFIAALADIRRADGIVANGTVKPESLHASTTALMGTGFTPRGAWLTATAYAVGDLVQGTTYQATYVCAVAHTSGVFLTDVAGVKWLCIAPFAPGQLASVPAAASGDVNKVLAVTGADTYAWAAVVGVPGFRNRLINADFTINQRGHASGGGISAGAYAHDRWKAGASGCTYSFTTTLPATGITISAGTLVQVVEGGHLEGGTFVLSWSGTAQCRVNGGSYGASPLSTAGLTAGTNATIEVGTGTFLAPQFEPSTQTTYERRPPAIEQAMCERYFRKVTLHGGGYASASGQFLVFPVVWGAMRATPTATLSTAGASTNITASDLVELSETSGYLTLESAAAGQVLRTGAIFTLAAEL